MVKASTVKHLIVSVTIITHILSKILGIMNANKGEFLKLLHLKSLHLFTF